MNQKTIISILGILAVAVVIVVLVVITSGKNKNLYDADTGIDPNLEISEAVIDDIDIRVLESFPVQVQVTATGILQDGCTELHEVLRERNDSVFTVTIQTERPRDAICTQEVRVFEETFPLDVEGLVAGEYVVRVNGVSETFSLSVDNIVEFDAGQK